VSRTSLCGLGQTAPNPVLTSLRYFREEFEAHVRDRRCPAGRCAALTDYRINASCIGCTLCAQPARWGHRLPPHERHAVDLAACTRCNMCFEACQDGRSRWCRAARSARSRPGRRRGRPEVATLTLTIDGRTATVEQGRTVLEAARSLGIEIPTLCHVEGLEPVSACFLCCVQVEGRAPSPPRARYRPPTAWS